MLDLKSLSVDIREELQQLLFDVLQDRPLMHLEHFDLMLNHIDLLFPPLRPLLIVIAEHRMIKEVACQ